MSDNKQPETVINNYSVFNDLSGCLVVLGTILCVWIYLGVEVKYEENGVEGIYISTAEQRGEEQ